MADEETVEPLKEGSRWRYAKPTADEVKEWFESQPLDDDMEAEDYLSGVVLIPASEKVKKTKQADGKKALEEVYELTFTPYVRVDMRVLYFTRLAEKRNLIRVIEPVEVPRIDDTGSAYFNAHMGDGFWWHCVPDGNGQTRRYLVSTHRVALYEKEPYLAGDNRAPLLEGIGTKQVNGGADENAIMKAETGAIGRALGVAGILVVGTGIATAEDMQEAMSGRQALGEVIDSEPAPPLDPAVQRSAMLGRATELEGQLKAHPATWSQFAAWWQERSTTEGWQSLADVPADALRGIIGKMERALDQAVRNPPPEQDPADEEAASREPAS